MAAIGTQTDTWTITFARPQGANPADALHYALDALGEWMNNWDVPESPVKVIGADIRRDRAASMLLDSCLIITRNDVLGPPKVTAHDIGDIA